MSERDRLNSSLSASHLISRLLIRRVFYAPMDAIPFFFFFLQEIFREVPDYTGPRFNLTSEK